MLTTAKQPQTKLLFTSGYYFIQGCCHTGHQPPQALRWAWVRAIGGMWNSALKVRIWVRLYKWMEVNVRRETVCGLCVFMYSYLAVAESLTPDRESNCQLIALSALLFITSSDLTDAVKTGLLLSALVLHATLQSFLFLWHTFPVFASFIRSFPEIP